MCPGTDIARQFGMQALPHCWAGAIIIAASLQRNSFPAPHFPGFANGDEPMMEFDTYENLFRKKIVTSKFQDIMPCFNGAA